MTPADCFIEAFGGVRPAARILNKHDLDLCPSAICHWRKRSGGTIPSRYVPFLIEVAKRENLNLTIEDLIYGRETTD